jgi:hypothetical protein
MRAGDDFQPQKAEGSEPAKFSLATAESYDNGVLYLNYRAQA